MKSVTTLALLASLGLAASVLAEPPKDTPKPDQKTEHKDKHDDKAKHDDKGKHEDKAGGVQIGAKAPDFTLTDTDGKTVKLADFKDKIVVLEWFNPGCPFILKHHKENTTFNDLHKEFSSKGVVFLAINSSGKGLEGNGVDANKKAKTDFNLPYPILMDEDGTVGHLYGARTTPHCFIINKDGTLAYNGAIDNKKSGAEGKNYVRNALNSLIKGETVAESKTEPYGCGVKFASKK